MAWTLQLAEWVGRSIGRWQRHRTSRRDDAYVRRWKEAWCCGRDARWAGAAQEAVPYRRPAQRQAWMAGWLWASTQPDRRNPVRPDRRMQRRVHPARRATDTSPAGDAADDAVAWRVDRRGAKFSLLLLWCSAALRPLARRTARIDPRRVATSSALSDGRV